MALTLWCSHHEKVNSKRLTSKDAGRSSSEAPDDKRLSSGIAAKIDSVAALCYIAIKAYRDIKEQDMREFIEHVKKVVAQDFRDSFVPFVALYKFMKRQSSRA